jgi:2-aminoadipate transaminase
MLRERGLRPRLFFVVPNFQNPTGATLSLERRHSLLRLAAHHSAAIVEDDPYRLLRYGGEDLPSLAALAGDVTVIQAGSFSKTFLPGIRVGWAIADPDLVRRMAAAKQTMDSSTSSLGQRLVVEFHRRGRFAPHLDTLRSLYQEKQSRARTALARDFAGTGVAWNDPEGGFYLWVTLPDGVSARRLLDAALEEGVAFVPGDAFAIERDHRAALRFSYSSPTPDRIDEGVARLRRAFDRVAQARPVQPAQSRPRGD